MISLRPPTLTVGDSRNGPCHYTIRLESHRFGRLNRSALKTTGALSSRNPKAGVPLQSCLLYSTVQYEGGVREPSAAAGPPHSCFAFAHRPREEYGMDHHELTDRDTDG